MTAFDDAAHDETHVPTRPLRDDTEMDITPMIDIVFLLLIFFLVASKLDESASVDLAEANYGIDVSQEESIIILVKKKGDDEAEVMREDGTPFSTDLETQEEEIAAYVTAGMSGGEPFKIARKFVLLKAEKGVKHRDVHRVTKAIGTSEEAPDRIHIAVLELAGGRSGS